MQQYPRISRENKICEVILTSGRKVPPARVPDQYFETSPDGLILYLWQTTPPEADRARFGARVVVDQCFTHEIRFLLTEPEAQILWDGGCRDRIFAAGAYIRLLILGDGSYVRATPEQFFQTTRDQRLMQLWQLEPEAPPIRAHYWYDTTAADQVHLIQQWQLDDVLWAISDDVILYAKAHGLLHAVLGA